MFVKAKVRLYHKNIKEPGEIFEVPDDNGESPAYEILPKAQVKKLGLTSEADDTDQA
jgi:hypothetical protein